MITASTDSFGGALEHLKAGHEVSRLGWNGKGMRLKLQVPDANSKMTLPYIYIEYPVNPEHHARDFMRVSKVPWLASQADLLADDWVVIS